MKTVFYSDALHRAFCAAWDAEDPACRGTREGFRSGFYSACATYIPGEPVAVVRYDKCGGNAGVRWVVMPMADAPMLEDGEPLYRLSDLLTLPQTEKADESSVVDDLLEALKYAIGQVPELGGVHGIAAAIAKAEGGAT
jgi:hypothetical protein